MIAKEGLVPTGCSSCGLTLLAPVLRPRANHVNIVLYTMVLTATIMVAEGNDH